MSGALHIVEPTLADTAGHCHALVMALACAVPADRPLHIWAARGLAGTWDGPGHLHAHFQARWRRWQAWLLFRRLLREGHQLLLSTATTTDLLLLDWAAHGQIAPQQVHAFVHWLNVRPSKLRLLQGLARRQPHLRIHVPTTSVLQAFVAAGFDADLVPYPLALRPAAAQAKDRGAAPTFRHLLVPGGSRLDKGFDCVVLLVEHLAREGVRWPITVQVSRESRHDHDNELDRWVARLRAAGYAGLQLIERPLAPADYAALFDGALVLQPYEPRTFADRVSGVTLDALAAGAPTVVPDATWMASVVRRFDAGAITNDRSPQALASAISGALGRYPDLAMSAAAAAPIVRAEHSASALMQRVLDSAPQAQSPL